MKTALSILGSILLVTLFLGCELIEQDPSLEQGDLPDTDKGAVTIVFNGGLSSSKTLKPPVVMEVNRYDIQGTLEGGGDSFQKTVPVGQSFSQSGLTPGLWTILVDARNADGTIIGDGGSTAQISAGSTTTVQIEIAPLSEVGTLDLMVQWPKKEFDSDDIVVTLTPAITPDPVFTIKTQDQRREGTYLNSAIPAGYYFLTLQLIGDGVPVWGIAEAVRILAGETTSQIYTYTPPN